MLIYSPHYTEKRNFTFIFFMFVNRRKILMEKAVNNAPHSPALKKKEENSRLSYEQNQNHKQKWFFLSTKWNSLLDNSSKKKKFFPEYRLSGGLRNFKNNDFYSNENEKT